MREVPATNFLRSVVRLWPVRPHHGPRGGVLGQLSVQPRLASLNVAAALRFSGPRGFQLPPGVDQSRRAESCDLLSGSSFREETQPCAMFQNSVGCRRNIDPYGL